MKVTEETHYFVMFGSDTVIVNNLNEFICRCRNKKTAEKVCAALNQAYSTYTATNNPIPQKPKSVCAI